MLEVLIQWAIRIVLAILVFVVVRWALPLLLALGGLSIPDQIVILIALLLALVTLAGHYYGWWVRRPAP